MPWLGLACPKLGRFARFYSDLNGWWVWCEFSSLQVVLRVFVERVKELIDYRFWLGNRIFESGHGTIRDPCISDII